MSTRAVYTFKDKWTEYHVYRHSDGYPEGAVKWISAAIPFAWELPRFEAGDFGCAFIAADRMRSKERGYMQGGSTSLMPNGPIKSVAPGDINYRYEIECESGAIVVTAFKTSYWKDADRVEEKLWRGPLSEMEAWCAARKVDAE